MILYKYAYFLLLLTQNTEWYFYFVVHKNNEVKVFENTPAKLVQNIKLIIANYCKQGLFPFKVLIIITLEGMFAFCWNGYIAILRVQSTRNWISY